MTSNKFKKICLSTAALVLITFLVLLLKQYHFSALHDNSDFDAFTDTMFKESITASTINLHYTLADPSNYEISHYPNTFGEISKSGHDRSLSELENTKKVLSTFIYDDLSKKNQMTYDILSDYVSTELSASSLYYYDELLRTSTGTQAELPILLAEYSFRRENDIKDYLALLSQMDSYFNSIAEFEKEKSKEGLFMSDYSANDIISQCDQFLDKKDDHYLITTFNTRIDAVDFLTDRQKNEYKDQNSEIFTEHVLPAYEILRSTLVSLNGSGTNENGLCYFPNGKKYYEYLIHQYTGTNSSVLYLEDMVKEQRQKDLTSISSLLTAHPELAAACNSYSFDEQSPENMINTLKQSITKDFPAPVDTVFNIKYVDPALQEYLAPAFYLTAPIDDISMNSIYINPKSQYTKIKLFTTLAHEGYPGHLYQTIMTASYGIPSVRVLFNYPGYTEGWATYVEMHSYHYAGLDENLATILQLNQSAILSLYSTADFGIHYEGWTYKDTLSFFSSYGITDTTTIKEIFELIVKEPGHYQKYYIGYLEFLQLKEKAKDILKSDYSDTLFHEAVLRMGPAPFPVLEKYLPYYLTSESVTNSSTESPLSFLDEKKDFPKSENPFFYT